MKHILRLTVMVLILCLPGRAQDTNRVVWRGAIYATSGFMVPLGSAGSTWHSAPMAGGAVRLPLHLERWSLMAGAQGGALRMKAQTGTTIGLVRFSLGIEPPGFPLGTLLSLQSSLALSSTGLFTNQHGGLQDLSIFASWESEFGILGSVCIELPLQHWMLGLECRYDRVFCHPRHFSSLITGLRVGRNIHW